MPNTRAEIDLLKDKQDDTLTSSWIASHSNSEWSRNLNPKFFCDEAYVPCPSFIVYRTEEFTFTNKLETVIQRQVATRLNNNNTSMHSYLVKQEIQKI
jgi:hypothetical protein